MAKLDKRDGNINDVAVKEFEVRVNGEVVWKSGSEAMLVGDISVVSVKGELAMYRPDNAESSIDINVNVRNPADSNLPLDIKEAMDRAPVNAAIEEQGAKLRKEDKDVQTALKDTPTVEELLSNSSGTAATTTTTASTETAPAEGERSGPDSQTELTNISGSTEPATVTGSKTEVAAKTTDK